MKDQLQTIGFGMFLYGILSMVLYFLNMNFIILMWMDLFGPLIGWTLRIIMVVLGISLYAAGKFIIKD